MLNSAKDALEVGRPQDAIVHLTAVPADSYYAQKAAGLLREARTARAKLALSAARVACKRRDWRTCHNESVILLSNQPQSSDGQKFVADSEKQLKKQKKPFTPWQP